MCLVHIYENERAIKLDTRDNFTVNSVVALIGIGMHDNPQADEDVENYCLIYTCDEILVFPG